MKIPINEQIIVISIFIFFLINIYFILRNIIIINVYYIILKIQ